MATIKYTFVSRCAGGGHTIIDVDLNAGTWTGRFTYDVDAIRSAISTISREDREALALLILKLHMAGKTRAQIVTELGAPITVTI